MMRALHLVIALGALPPSSRRSICWRRYCFTCHIPRFIPRFRNTLHNQLYWLVILHFDASTAYISYSIDKAIYIHFSPCMSIVAAIAHIWMSRSNSFMASPKPTATCKIFSYEQLQVILAHANLMGVQLYHIKFQFSF